jgi:mono/diheme cytochrome c family protein
MNRIYWFFWLGTGFWACTREYVQDLRPVCFEREVLPIFQSNCTQSGCHNSADRQKGYDFSNYAGIVERGVVPGDYRASEVYRAIVALSGEEAMPPKPYKRLSDAQITTIALWIDEGAAQTDCADVAACDTLNVTFSASVQPILSAYCNGCHGGGSPQGSVDFNAYAGVKASVASGRLLGAIQHDSGYSPMPKNANQLSDCNIQKIKTWVAAGALDN